MTKVLTGTFQLPSGSPVAFGTLYLKLTQDATVIGTGQIVPATPLAFTLDMNGTLGSGVTVYASDELNPSGISYVLTVSEQGGGQVFGPEFFVISGVSPINLNNLTPTANSPVVFSTAILSNPTAPQTITGQSLTLTPSAPLIAQGAATFSAAVTSSGPFSVGAGRVGGFRFVDSSNSFAWSGATADLWVTAAISDLPSTGGTVYLGPGVFTFANTLTISKANVVLIGAGSVRSSSIGAPGATVIRGGTTAAPVVSIAATAWNTRFYHMQFDNEGGSALSTMAIQIVGGAFHFFAEDVSFGNTQKFTVAGVQSTNAAISAFIVFRDCFFNGAAPINLDIDRANGLILDHTTLVGNANTTTANIRLGTTTLVTGTWIGNGSDIELQSTATAAAVDILLVRTANTVIRDSFIETIIDAVPGFEGQLAISVSASTNNQLIIEGNYFQGNAHTNYAIATTGSPSNIFINQNEFTGQLLAAVNPSSGQTHVIFGDNFYTGGTPAGAFVPAIQWIDSSAQPNFGKPILLNGAASGAITLAVPAVAGSNTATFQAATGTIPLIIANGTSTLTANATLGAVTSQAAITTAATGAATTDSIEWAYASAPGAGDSLCIVSAYVTSGNVNFVRANPTAASQNVSAIVINWRVIR